MKIAYIWRWGRVVAFIIGCSVGFLVLAFEEVSGLTLPAQLADIIGFPFAIGAMAMLLVLSPVCWAFKSTACDGVFDGSRLDWLFVGSGLAAVIVVFGLSAVVVYEIGLHVRQRSALSSA